MDISCNVCKKSPCVCDCKECGSKPCVCMPCVCKQTICICNIDPKEFRPGGKYSQLKETNGEQPPIDKDWEAFLGTLKGIRIRVVDGGGTGNQAAPIRLINQLLNAGFDPVKITLMHNKLTGGRLKNLRIDDLGVTIIVLDDAEGKKSYDALQSVNYANDKIIGITGANDGACGISMANELKVSELVALEPFSWHSNQRGLFAESFDKRSFKFKGLNLLKEGVFPLRLPFCASYQVDNKKEQLKRTELDLALLSSLAFAKDNNIATMFTYGIHSLDEGEEKTCHFWVERAMAALAIGIQTAMEKLGKHKGAIFYALSPRNYGMENYLGIWGGSFHLYKNSDKIEYSNDIKVHIISLNHKDLNGLIQNVACSNRNEVIVVLKPDDESISQDVFNSCLTQSDLPVVTQGANTVGLMIEHCRPFITLWTNIEEQLPPLIDPFEDLWARFLELKIGDRANNIDCYNEVVGLMKDAYNAIYFDQNKSKDVSKELILAMANRLSNFICEYFGKLSKVCQYFELLKSNDEKIPPILRNQLALALELLNQTVAR